MSRAKVDWKSKLNDKQIKKIKALYAAAEDSEDRDDIPGSVKAEKDVVMAFINEELKESGTKEDDTKDDSKLSESDPLAETVKSAPEEKK